MSQTIVGAAKARDTIRAKYGVTEDGKSIMHQRIGSIGGSKGTADGVIKGFALNRELAEEAGRRGGLISKRGRKPKP